MLSHLLCFFLAIGTIFAVHDFVDANCTRDGVYTQSAFSCENKFNDVFCNTLFGTSPPPAVEESFDRSPACYQNGRDFTISDDMKNGVIASCAKTCGYCCQTPEYDCENKGIRIKCDSVTQDQCKDPKWKEFLTTECPATCGFCTRKPKVDSLSIHSSACADAVPGCANDPTFCRNVDSQEFVRENCKKTCGFCWGKI